MTGLNITILLALLFGFSLFVPDILSQTPGNADTVRQERERRRVEKNLNERIKEMRQLTESRREPSLSTRVAQAENKSSKAAWERILKEARIVESRVYDRYRVFLDQKNTGIITLLPNADCATSLTIQVSDECEGFVPDSSDFTFRTKKYTDGDSHDISLNRNKLITKGFFSHGILLSLGDVPIENVNLETISVNALSRFVPDTDIQAARRTAKRLLSGYEDAGFRFANFADVAADTTYALRVIAYGLSNPVPLYNEQIHTVQRNFGGSNFTDRDMVTVIFRVVSVQPDGKLTIVWKELDRADAPKLKFRRGEEWTDIWP